MRIVALLPMKGNSERVPNKNLKQFCGTPLYHKVLNSLLASNLISEVVINTDSDEIMKDVRAHYSDTNVTIFERPQEIRGDTVSMNKVIEYDIDRIEADYYLQTHSTNPLLKTETIDNALNTIRDHLNESFRLTSNRGFNKRQSFRYRLDASKRYISNKKIEKTEP